MAENPPYLVSSGTLSKAFERIKSAATPERVTGDFVSTVLGFKGGTGAALPPFFKRIGFVRSDGAPSDLYNQFRNPSTSQRAAAAAFRTGYKQLFDRNEYIHKADDQALKGVIVEATGLEADSRVVQAIFGTIKAFKPFCDFDAQSKAEKTEDVSKRGDSGQGESKDQTNNSSRRELGMNLAYTINLNLPATDDVRVFDAIFKSLKEHLLQK